MKVITFFNEKGGSAKSTFATLFASWLQYELGIKTALVDIDNRIARDRVMQLMMRPECEGREFWDIFDVNQNYLKKINEKSHIRIDSYAEWFKAFNRNGKFKKYEVIVIDFPGNMEDFLEFYKKDLLSLIVIPVERDTHTMSTTIRLSRFLKNKDVPYIGFINKAQSFQNMVPVLSEWVTTLWLVLQLQLQFLSRKQLRQASSSFVRKQAVFNICGNAQNGIGCTPVAHRLHTLCCTHVAHK